VQFVVAGFAGCCWVVGRCESGCWVVAGLAGLQRLLGCRSALLIVGLYCWRQVGCGGGCAIVVVVPVVVVAAVVVVAVLFLVAIFF
jgi:hypothetical protein